MVPRLVLESALLAVAARIVLRDARPGASHRADRFLGVALAINAVLPALLAIALMFDWARGARSSALYYWPWPELLGVLLLGFAKLLQVIEDVRENAERRTDAAAHARAELESSQARLLAAWEHTDDRVVLVDRDLNVVAHNRAWERVVRRYYEAGTDPLVGQPIARFQGLSAGADWDGWYAAALGGRALTVPLHIKPGHGAEMLEARLSPVEEHGRITGALLTLRDVTDRARLETALTQAQRMESIGRLAGGIAHDFNNLLTAILGNVALARTSLPADAPVQEDLSEIEACSQRASALTRQLLAFARRQPVEPRVICPSAEIRQLERMLARLLGSDVEMRIIAAADTWPVQVDATQLEQVIVNLAVNARDAMPEGGRLLIDVSNVRLDETWAARVPEAGAGEWVRITVRDSGAGIPPDVVGRIFEPFFTTKEQGGSGLGLAQCHGNVRQAGGFITVASTEGRGTTFEVYLPRHHGEVDAPAEEVPVRSLPRGAGTLLLVEDEPAVRAFAARALRNLGYDVLEAADGIEALSLLERSPRTPSAVLSDVVMPRMGGRQLLRRIRERWPSIPVLLTSGYDAALEGGGTGSGSPRDEALSEDALRQADGFLAKPYSVDALARCIHDVITRPRNAGDRVA
jgi:signal transduction histidine kinase/CheY-like chemotaxis protein